MGTSTSKADVQFRRARTFNLAQQGWSTKAIAADLGITPGLVSRYRQQTGCSAQVEQTPEAKRARLDRAVELTKSGWSAEQIAAELDVSPRAVHRYRTQAGITTPRPPELTVEQIATAERMLTDGASLLETARTLGCSIDRLYRRFKGRGWSKAQVAEHRTAVRLLGSVLND